MDAEQSLIEMASFKTGHTNYCQLRKTSCEQYGPLDTRGLEVDIAVIDSATILLH